MEQLTLDKFWELLDDFLVKNEIKMSIKIPEGSNQVVVKDNINSVSVIQFYILLRTIPAIFWDMAKTLNLDLASGEAGELIDELLELAKEEILDGEPAKS